MIKGQCISCGKEAFITEEDKLCNKCFANHKILVVDIEFKDGLILYNCGIFDNEKQGELVIQNEELIKKRFQKLPWYSRWDGWIYFQNNNINGHCHVENIKSYKVKYVNKYDL